MVIIIIIIKIIFIGRAHILEISSFALKKNRHRLRGYRSNKIVTNTIKHFLHTKSFPLVMSRKFAWRISFDAAFQIFPRIMDVIKGKVI